MASDKTDALGQLPAWKWTGAEILDFVYALNERALQVLSQVVSESGGNRLQCANLEIVSGCEDLWLKLDHSGRRRAAKCPFLLLDVNFESLKSRHPGEDLFSRAPKKSNSVNVLPPEAARELTAEALTLAWHTAKSDPRTAALVLGLSPGVAGTIASLNPRDVQRLAAHHSHELRPRWPSNIDFWRKLLVAAERGDAEALTDIYLHGLQLLAAELLHGEEST
jgi:hypothetical protein